MWTTCLLIICLSIAHSSTCYNIGTFEIWARCIRLSGTIVVLFAGSVGWIEHWVHLAIPLSIIMFMMATYFWDGGQGYWGGRPGWKISKTICRWCHNRKNNMHLFECQSRPKKLEVARTNLNSSIAWKLHAVVCVEVGKITIFVPYLLPFGYVFVWQLKLSPSKKRTLHTDWTQNLQNRFRK